MADAAMGMLRKDMANLFNENFNLNRTGEDLRGRYYKTSRALNPETPDMQRPAWANNKTSAYTKIQSSFESIREAREPIIR